MIMKLWKTLWFENKLDTLDAVCFAIKATDARLSSSQKYVFDSILNLFGKDIKNNIFVLITCCVMKNGKCSVCGCDSKYHVNKAFYWEMTIIIRKMDVYVEKKKHE